MIAETLSELYIEFITILEEVNLSENPTRRKALIRHARRVFHKSVGTWQEELVVLNCMLQSLSKADSQLVKLVASTRGKSGSRRVCRH